MAKGGQTAKDPTTPEMKAAWQLRETGDVLAARREAARILANTSDADTQAQAQELLARTATPLPLYGYAALAFMALVLLVALATRY